MPVPWRVSEIRPQWTGDLIEKPKRLTNGADACISNANATADGKRLALLQFSGKHGTTYIADLEAGGSHIRNSRHFTTARTQM